MTPDPLTVAAAVARYGPAMERKLRPVVERIGVPWPPPRLVLVAYKEERRLDVWAFSPRRHGKIASYPILAASGVVGPKRREGDRQVPEGFYRLTALNPRSRFHLSIRVDYPNAEDVARSTVPKEAMGGDIYIHGNAVSIGCLAMGDPAIEEIFSLVATVGLARANLLIAPWDLARRPAPATDDPALRGVYERLARVLRQFEMPDPDDRPRRLPPSPRR